MNSPLSNSPRIAVFGAGVIGQTYASLLHRAGSHVTLLARGSSREQLHNNDVNMLRNDPHTQKLIVPVPVADAEQPPLPTLYCLQFVLNNYLAR
ncbi:ketopantoate reductase family protein [Corynebacterium durum]|uniref:ketopantoate reductase family protein n=1 Tax=Corynebacterium durum TaxID=61592 RepID=UPI0036F2EC72